MDLTAGAERDSRFRQRGINRRSVPILGNEQTLRARIEAHKLFGQRAAAAPSNCQKSCGDSSAARSTCTRMPASSRYWQNANSRTCNPHDGADALRYAADSHPF